MPRELTEAEEDAFLFSADHTNANETFCCPHCLESSPQPGVRWQAVAVECPKCGMEFAARLNEATVYESAKLPAPAEG